ncbi:hypothetical protein VTH06DRAFT_6801 [Thermothelomyces fergusii]
MTTRLSALVPSKLAIGLAVLPVAIPVAYLLYLDRILSTRFRTVTGVRDKRRPSASDTSPIPPDIPPPASLPEEVRADADGSEWVLACERVVSEPLALALAPSASAVVPDLVTRYVRATMAAFSGTPQAWLLWASVDGRARRTFAGRFIGALAFRPGDRANGFWVVRHRGEHRARDRSSQDERVEMALDPPPGHRGGPAAVRGLVVAGLETRGEDGMVVFVNETWMWRLQGEEAPVLLERPLGRWLHAVLARWLVMKGLEAVSEGGQVIVHDT